MFPPKKIAAALIAIGVGSAGISFVAHAQTPAQKVDKIEVTGSNIKRVDSESPSPIQIITRDDIQKSGTTTVAELLRDIPSVSGGSVQDFNAGNGFGRGNQSVSLRGLGSVSTLVLINGRRVEQAPIADPNFGQGAGFNLNVIPVGAIERIEVLKDGASAIYGSDAIAGVINIILRKDYTGGEVTYSGRQNHDNDFRGQTITGTAGWGDLAKDRYNVMVSAEFFKRDATKLSEVVNVNEVALSAINLRNFPNSSASYPPNLRREAVNGNGAFTVALPLDPRCPASLTFGTLCRSDTNIYLNGESPAKRKSIFARGAIDFSSTLSGFAEFRFTRSENTFTSAPPALDASAPSTWFNAAGQRFGYTLFLPVGHPDNPNAFRLGLRYRFNDLGPSYNYVTNDSTSGVVGLNGNLASWDWESALTYGKTKRLDHGNGQLYLPALQAAVANGTYRFFGSNSDAVLSTLEPYKDQNGASKNVAWDLKGSRELMQLAGGPMQIATGLQLRKEDFDITSDPRNVAGEFIGVASSTVHGSRKVSSVYAELSVPFIKNVEMQLAGRYDHYSDYGNSTTPKIGIKWNPIATVALRATYSEAFRAPSLLQISSGNVQSFNNGIIDRLRCGAVGAVAEDCNKSISSLISANTKLQPEKSKSYSSGIIFSPTTDTSVSLDYFNIHRRDFIDRYDSQTVVNNENNPNFRGGTVIRDPNPATWLPGVANSGPIQSTIRRFDNFGEAIVAGLDLDFTTNFNLGANGKLKVTAQSTYLTKSALSFQKGDPLVSGLANFYGFETPRVRGTLAATWTYQDFSVLGRGNYTGKWMYGDGTDGGTCYASASTVANAMNGRCEIPFWATMDASVSYTGFKNVSLSVLVRNIFNRNAPYDPGNTVLGFNPTFHSGQGTNYVVNATYKFK
ncbi:MAG: TonB-dependent receptor [Betaproteobacteria bacterium]